jgi:hypothetical protein
MLPKCRGPCRESALHVQNRSMEPAISVVPANEASWEDVQTVFGTRGPASRCQCQRYKLRRRESFASFPVEDRAHRLRQQTDCGHRDSGTTLEELHVGTEGVFADAGFTEVSRPTLRRVVMRIDF